MCQIFYRCGVLFLALLGFSGCAASSPAPSPRQGAAEVASEENAGTPSPAIQAWMDRLTVDHSYDPETGFIVAREVIELPTVIVEGPTLPEAIDRGRDESKLLIVFATADRCAPCQQYKKSALNDARVIDRLGGAGVLVTHVEVDREPELAEELLGSRAIPMTYAFRDGERVAMLRGQRSAEELLDWLDEQRESADG